MRLKREAPKLGSYCVILPPCEDEVVAWVVNCHVMLGKGEVVGGVTERAYPCQGVGKVWHYVSIGGEVVTYLGNGKICRGSGVHKLAIGCPNRYFWRQGIGVNV